MDMTATVAGRLTGRHMPGIALAATDGGTVDLSARSGVTVVYAYPRTSPPDAPPIEGWDEIPGARGCTPQSCGYRDHHAELKAAGADRIFGLSVQDTDYQREVAVRLRLPFPLLSDEGLMLQSALDLPVFDAGGMTLLARLSMVIEDGVIAHVVHPVPDPAANAADMVTWLMSGRGA